MKKVAIGIDIGGTKISLILGTSLGKILLKREIPTLTGKQTMACVESVKRHLTEMIRESRLPKSAFKGIGVGIPGAVDSQKGIVPRSPHLPGWKGLPLKKIFQSAFKLPTYMANDANAAALGEKYFGGGQSVKDFIYVTVSTGVGGGIIINQKLLEGTSYVAGEIGHMTIVPKGNLCKCGKNGCLEAYASGTAIAADARRLLKAGRKSKVTKWVTASEPVSAKLLARAAKEKDALALEVFERAAFYLGIGLANLLNILNPEKIVLGGGVFKSCPGIFWEEMLRSCRVHAWPEAYQNVKIAHSKFKDTVSDMGTLALALGLGRDK